MKLLHPTCEYIHFFRSAHNPDIRWHISVIRFFTFSHAIWIQLQASNCLSRMQSYFSVTAHVALLIRIEDMLIKDTFARIYLDGRVYWTRIYMLLTELQCIHMDHSGHGLRECIRVPSFARCRLTNDGRKTKRFSPFARWMLLNLVTKLKFTQNYISLYDFLWLYYYDYSWFMYNFILFGLYHAVEEIILYCY